MRTPSNLPDEHSPNAQTPLREDVDLPHFVVPPDAEPITLERTLAAEDEF
jgi:hypothetical protein